MVTAENSTLLGGEVNVALELAEMGGACPEQVGDVLVYGGEPDKLGPGCPVYQSSDHISLAADYGYGRGQRDGYGQGRIERGIARPGSRSPQQGVRVRRGGPQVVDHQEVLIGRGHVGHRHIERYMPDRPGFGRRERLEPYNPSPQRPLSTGAGGVHGRTQRPQSLVNAVGVGRNERCPLPGYRPGRPRYAASRGRQARHRSTLP